MKSNKQIIGRLALTALCAGSLASCQKARDVEPSDLPIKVINQLDPISREALANASYQIHKYGSVKAYVIALPEGYCGSGGCQTFIIVEKAGKVETLYEDLAQYVSVLPVYPDHFQFNIGRSGVMCGKLNNASDCHWIRTWPTAAAPK
jgi:hypothetical protein